MEDLFRPAGQAVDDPAVDEPLVLLPAPPPTTRPSRRRRVLLILAIVVTTTLVAASATGVLWAKHLENVFAAQLRTTTDPFASMDDRQRPRKTSDAIDMLVLAADTKLDLEGSGTWAGDAEELDAVLLVHISADRSTTDVVTLPRLTVTAVRGHGSRTLADALSLGGPALLIGTIEDLTGVRVDNLVAIDYEGFTQLTDALGGVDVTVPPGRPAEGTRFAPGTIHMDGATALAFVREGDGRASDELLRSRRQQAWLRAIATTALSKDLVTHPGRFSSILEAVGASLTVDASLTTSRIRALAVSMRSMRGGDIRYATAPGTPAGPDRYVLSGRAEQLWQTLRSDDRTGVAAALDQG